MPRPRAPREEALSDELSWRMEVEHRLTRLEVLWGVLLGAVGLDIAVGLLGLP